MKRVVTYSFCEPFLERFTQDLVQDYQDRGQDWRRIAIVFGGHRPALFVRRLLAARIGRAFYPPRFFSMDEFMRYTAARGEAFEPAGDLDQSYVMYQLVRRHCPELLAGRDSFARFLPWAGEMVSFIEQLDLEAVENAALQNVERNARIGYEVPEEINRLLRRITVLREAFHQHMRDTGHYTRGFQYRRAAQTVEQVLFDEFDDVLFANFFYLNRSEQEVITSLYQAGKARLFFQGDERRWPVLTRIGRVLNTPIREAEEVPAPAFELKLYRGFDVHSQVCQLREILKTIEDWNKTVIVLPEPDHILPLLSEIGPMVQDFNISLGYPLKRSAVVSLVEQIFAAQCSRDERGYYARDYLRLLKHPLVKSLRLHENAQTVRVLVHKVEEVLTGRVEAPGVSGCVFVALEDVEGCPAVFEEARRTLAAMGVTVEPETLRIILVEMHRLCGRSWQGLNDFASFGQILRSFLDVLARDSVMRQYPLNTRVASRLAEMLDEFEASDFVCEQFPSQDIFRIVLEKIEREIVAFHGSPLKGLQMLGLFETRSLNFDHVIVLDANEGVLPRLRTQEALVPRDVMVALNLDRMEQEEEIQRYGFMRLISSAKHVHLIYQENRERERSRFVEELVWDQEQRCGQIGCVGAVRTGFPLKARQGGPAPVFKTPAMLDFLRRYRYSASSINTYLQDPMMFFDQSVLGLRPQDDLLDEPENRQVGTFIHEVLEEIFRPWIGRRPEWDSSLCGVAQEILDRRFRERFARSRRSDLFFLKRVMDERLRRFIEAEIQRGRDVAEILCLEATFDDTVCLPAGELNFVYKIDRIDRMIDGTILLLDYKTGSSDVLPGKLEEVRALGPDRQEIREVVKSFQLPLYFHYLRQTFPEETVDTGLYNVRDCHIKSFLGQRGQGDPADIDRTFLRALNLVVAEILDPAVPFTANR